MTVDRICDCSKPPPAVAVAIDCSPRAIASAFLPLPLPPCHGPPGCGCGGAHLQQELLAGLLAGWVERREGGGQVHVVLRRPHLVVDPVQQPHELGPTVRGGAWEQRVSSAGGGGGHGQRPYIGSGTGRVGGREGERHQRLVVLVGTPTHTLTRTCTHAYSSTQAHMQAKHAEVCSVACRSLAAELHPCCTALYCTAALTCA